MAYVEYEADGKTIKARVQQKTDTLANWMANDMVIKAGEQAFVINDDGSPLNFKIGDGTKPFRDLPNWIDFSNAQRVSSVAPGVLPAGPAEETKYMEVTAIGTYTYGGNTLAEITDDGYKATFWWTGTEWISNGVVRVKGDEADTTTIMLMNEQYGVLSTILNHDGVISSANIEWEDGVTGVLTFGDYNPDWMAYDSYTITYQDRIVTQPKVTRDSNGTIIILPLKTIS